MAVESLTRNDEDGQGVVPSKWIPWTVVVSILAATLTLGGTIAQVKVNTDKNIEQDRAADVRKAEQDRINERQDMLLNELGKAQARLEGSTAAALDSIAKSLVEIKQDVRAERRAHP